jgi:tRNA1Val (adenine37-N6)-methyltransferase
MLLYQPESGYRYNGDSLFLYDFVNAFKPKGKVLDVGAGCGVVGLLVARDNEKVELEAVEKQAQFIRCATTNARVNKIACEMREGDFLELDDSVKYDYIISNPPFYSEGVQKSEDESLSQARYNANLPLSSFFKKASRLLKPQSHFIFCYDATQFALVCAELDRAKLRVVDARFVHPKADKPASLVMIHARNGSKSMMKILPPLISFEGEGHSQTAKEIYAKSQTWSVTCQI